MQPKISVALATFNGEKYIRAQLETVLAQSRPADEIVITDDNSADATLEIAGEVLRDFSGRVVIRGNDSQLGYKRNFMQAFALCTGDIVVFSDQDDLWKPDKLEKVARALQDDTLVVTHNFEVIDADESVMIPDYYRHLTGTGKRRQDSAKGCAMAINKRCLPEGFPAGYDGQAHDVLFLKTAILASSIRHLDDILIAHRIHGENTSGRISGRDGILGILWRKLAFALRHGRSEMRYALRNLPSTDTQFYLRQLRDLAARGYDCADAIIALEERRA